MKDKSLYQIWTDFRPKLAIICAIIPLAGMMFALFTGYDSEKIIKFGMAALTLQLGFIIAIELDTQKIITNQYPKEITKIQFNSAFWNVEKKYKRFYLNALNGERFYEMIELKGIKIDSVHIIMPSEKAMETYYASDIIVTNPVKSKQVLIESIDTVKDNFKSLLTKGVIKEFEVRELGTFPLDFYAIFDGKTCLVGKYLKDPSRKLNVGIKSVSWMEKDPQLVNYYTLHFEELWDSLGKLDESR